MQTNGETLVPTRKSLLLRLKNWQDQESWRDFFNTYWKLIYSVARKSGLNESEAQEVVQETVISVAKGINSFEYRAESGSFKSWLLTITRRRITDQLRRNYAHPRTVSAKKFAPESGTPLTHRIPDDRHWEQVWEQEWETNLLDLALENIKARVKSRQYQLFDCFVLKEWPMEQVIERLQVSKRQVYFAKYKITLMLQREIQKLRRTCGRAGMLAT
jgi:RNA polymerase sigma-70 factor (ECF subfamily)